jgi:hypothetical protein
MARHKPNALADLDQPIAAITLDAYGDDEPQTAFVEVLNQEVRLPAAATVLGMPVNVVGFDYQMSAWASSPGAAAKAPDRTSQWLISSPAGHGSRLAARRLPPVARPGPASVRHAGRLAAVVAAGPVASAAARRRLSFMELSG